MIDDATAARFWARVDRSGGPDACWFYIVHGRHGNYIQKNFPVSALPGYLSHQLAYALTYGEPPMGMIIRHRCANGGCCNPAHHRLGTHRENRLDQAVRKRLGIPRGVLFTYEDEE